MATASDSSSRKTLLLELTEKSKKLKRLTETIDNFVECTSFISDNAEIKQVVGVVNNFDGKVDEMQAYFDNLNSGLYDLANDSDVFPCASQDPDSVLETETFKEKKQLSARIVTKTRVYVENPCFMESALAIADNDTTRIEASKFLRRQYKAVFKILVKFFPEEEASIPSVGEGLTCSEKEMFEKICMPLVHILGFFWQ